MGKNNHPGRLRPPCFVLKLSCAGAAFTDGNWQEGVADILRNLCDAALEDMDVVEGPLIDTNGNRVGEWRYRP